ncbi:MAG: transposase [Planctomycetales bacterium]|nr:transposase [Planctomycetales bacterium]
MSALLDVRVGFRLSILFAGALLATGRRTASRWFAAAGVGDDWDRFYDVLSTMGRKSATLMTPLLSHIVRKFGPEEGGHWTVAIDDSPTSRFGPCVEAANIHHNPTPGPGDGPWLYGHCWVCLAAIVRHPLFGAIALPLLSSLYVREADVGPLQQRHGWQFRTKHELALKLCQEVMMRLRAMRSLARVLVTFDGAYAAKSLVQSLMKEGAMVVARIRRDAKLFDLPVRKEGQRGRPRKYGVNRISLAKRAAHRDGWQTIQYSSRGIMTEARYKSFLATTELAGGQVRVVLLKHSSGNWAAFMGTDPAMSVETILEATSNRWAIEENFHDVKEVWGAGEQQVRNIWSNVACWNICTWLYSMVELACWDEPVEKLVDRSSRPWDNPDRRPSHADRRRRIIRQMLREKFFGDQATGPDETKMREHLEHLLTLAV